MVSFETSRSPVCVQSATNVYVTDVAIVPSVGKPQAAGVGLVCANAVAYHTLIAPRFPEKLLEQNADQKSAYDIHGIHPNDLVGKPSFPDIHGTLWEIMQGKNWVCWNSDFDVTLLDSLCIRHHLPLIPRNRVVCAMKLLSPLADKWDEGRAAYRWASLEDMANVMQLEFSDAHDAAADVRTTISAMH